MIKSLYIKCIENFNLFSATIAIRVKEAVPQKTVPIKELKNSIKIGSNATLTPLGKNTNK